MSNEIQAEKALGVLDFIRKNKFVFFTLYYLTMIFYCVYVKPGEYYYFDLAKKYLIKYNDLAVFLVVFSIPISFSLRKLSDYIIHVSVYDDRKHNTAVDILITANRLDEVIWIISLIIAPIAFFYNVTFRSYWFYALGLCIISYIFYSYNKWIYDKYGIMFDIG